MLHPCKCRFCAEEFQTWEARRLHSKEAHGVSSRTSCQCSDCGETFFSRKARHRHQMQAHRHVKVKVTTYSSRRAKRQRRHLGKVRNHDGQQIATQEMPGVS